MKGKIFLAIAIATTVLIGTFTVNQITEAQRPDRPDRQRAEQRRRRMGGGMNPAMNYIGGSWTGLTFVVKVDDETLLKARPIHQKAIDQTTDLMKKAREAGDWESAKEGMKEINEKFKADLKEILTEEQVDKLEKHIKSQMRQGKGRGDRGGRGDRQRPREGGSRR